MQRLRQRRSRPVAPQPAARAIPTATGISSPSVRRVGVNDTAAPMSARAPASIKAEEKLRVACTMQPVTIGSGVDTRTSHTATQIRHDGTIRRYPATAPRRFLAGTAWGVATSSGFVKALKSASRSWASLRSFSTFRPKTSFT
jgi:hypothetical protein